MFIPRILPPKQKILPSACPPNFKAVKQSPFTVICLALGLGFTGEVSSPTFAIINEYLGGRLNLYHFDMYRVNSWEDLYSTGFFDYLQEGGVLAVEWSENIESALPDDTIRVKIERIDDNVRRITVER